MLIEFLTPQIVNLHYPSQYHVCSAFIRIQEFYESPNPDFNGKFFTMDEYMDWYVDYQSTEPGMFTYFEDWSGFNIPGHVIKRFYDCYTPMCMRPKELDIVKAVQPLIDSGKKFYVIGTASCCDSDTLAHELRHATYYLDDNYREQCKAIYATIPENIKKTINARLKKYGYSSSVWEDETQAYLSTESVADLMQRFETDLDLSDVANAYAALKID